MMKWSLVVSVIVVISGCSSSIPKLTKSNDNCYANGESFNLYSNCVTNRLLPLISKHKNIRIRDIENAFNFSDLMGASFDSGVLNDRQAKGELHDYLSNMISSAAPNNNLSINSEIQQSLNNQPQAYQNYSMPNRMSIFTETPITAALMDSYVSGANKICIYDQVGSQYVKTVNALESCPLTIN